MAATPGAGWSSSRPSLPTTARYSSIRPIRTGFTQWRGTRVYGDRPMAARAFRTWRPAGLAVPRHTHELTSLAFCLEGPFEETFGTNWQQVSTASLWVRPGGEPHANRYPARASSRTLIVELLP